MGPQTGFAGSAFGMRSNLVGWRFAQNGPQDRENRFFWLFGPVWAPGGREIYLNSADPQNAENHELPEIFLNTTQHRQSKKVAQRERGSNEPKKS